MRFFLAQLLVFSSLYQTVIIILYLSRAKYPDFIAKTLMSHTFVLISFGSRDVISFFSNKQRRSIVVTYRGQNVVISVIPLLIGHGRAKPALHYGKCRILVPQPCKSRVVCLTKH